MLWGEDFFIACGIIVTVVFLVINIVKLACGVHKTCKLNRQREQVRRAAVYTIASDPRTNEATNNFNDFIWNVPPSQINETSKDEKDLPSYEEVMRMEMAQQLVGLALTDPNRNRIDPAPVANTHSISPAIRGEHTSIV